ncbi:hypothetical protein [Herbiconiux sp. YIM B11900]|uniref:hypothetical protein n=1 Tax=Herbiconiux sp. YIM B11900 TaxID=3404131 RepID=UPI003F83D0DA
MDDLDPESRLSEAQYATLHALAEIITPATPGFPSAAQADPSGAVLEMALRELVRDRPVIAAFTDAVAHSWSTGVQPDLEGLEAIDPAGFAVVCDLLVGRYLSCRPVWRLLGYPGRVPAPPAPGEVEFFLRDDLLAPVVARGPIYTVPPA